MTTGYIRTKWFSLAGALFLLGTFGQSAAAQMMIVDTAQADLVKKSGAEQSKILASIVRGSGTNAKCATARASLEKTYNTGSGGWLVMCDEGQDYWVLVPSKSRTAATTLPCALARTSGTDCYASIKTVLPEHAEQCASPQSSRDRVIRACTAFIQSGRFADQPAVIFAALLQRALAYAGYGQLEIALADFDKAAALQPNDLNALYNRAVTLERLNRYDQALADLEKFLAQRPDELNALYERGYVYLKKGDHDRAIVDFDRVLSISPGFEKAVRNRAIAQKAKENTSSAQSAPQQAKAPDVNATPASTDANRQAAYCMEASFGLMQQLTKLVAILKENRGQGQAFLAQPTTSPSERTQIAAVLKRLDDDIATNEKNRAQREADLKLFMAHLEKGGLLGGKTNPELLSQTSAEVRKDQQDMQANYAGCLRGCAAGDNSCRKACNDKADNSEASQRMSRCNEVARNFKG